jgi:hypothetical protein
VLPAARSYAPVNSRYVHTSADPKLLLRSFSAPVTPPYLIKWSLRIVRRKGMALAVVWYLNNANLRHAIVFLPSQFLLFRRFRGGVIPRIGVDRMLSLTDLYMLKGNFHCFLFVTLCMSRSYCRHQCCRDMENPEFQLHTTISQRQAIIDFAFHVTALRILARSFLMPRCQWELSWTAHFVTEDTSRGSVG